MDPLVHKPLDIKQLELALAPFSGLDRYQDITWHLTGPPDRTGLVIRAREKTYAPPFLMLGLNLNNTTSEDFQVQMTGRYLAYDLVGSGSELRLDVGLGSNPSIGAAVYKPLFTDSFFGRAYGEWKANTFNFANDDEIVAKYRTERVLAGGELGSNLSRDSEVAAGFEIAHLSTTIRAGDPGLPELSGPETTFHVRWVYDGQDSVVVPSRGQRATAILTHYLQSPDAPEAVRTNDELTQFEVRASSFWSLNRQNRLFSVLSGGTSFSGHPLPTEQFTVGYPFQLDAFTVGSRLGDHYAVLTVGYLRQVTRLPDFLGGPVYAGGWLENGLVFNSSQDADFNSQAAAGIVADTLIGPIVGGVSAGFDGGWRTFIAIGRIFR